MTRAIGGMLVVLGLLPFAGVFLLWATHMYTVGIAVDFQGAAMVVILALVDAALLIGGAWMLRQRPTAN
jgi:hypothetical protein